jgi:RNase adapter protein RapZ
MADFVLLTGMSGAGRSTAANVFEDQGWFVIDNLPLQLVSKVAELVDTPDATIDRVAFVITRNDADELAVGGLFDQAVEQLRRTGARVRIVVLESSDDVLIRRYEGTRRRHPSADNGRVIDGITKERKLLELLKAQADMVIDTSNLNVHQLRDRIGQMVTEDTGTMTVNVVSFGFKHGIPTDVDLVFDLRFLPNPHWVDELRPFTGLDEPVRDYVMGNPETKAFLERLTSLFEMLLPAYAREGKSYLSVGIGCTGGQHRSVAVSHELGQVFSTLGFPANVRHRDLDKR